MRAIGLFEAKTRFSEICERVAAKGEAVLVTRRGKPLVRIEPVPPDDANAASVWDRRAAYIRNHGLLTEDFTPPARRKQTWRNPLDE
jgi:prevent-host-death family protein